MIEHDDMRVNTHSINDNRNGNNHMRKMNVIESRECIKFRDNYLLNDEFQFELIESNRVAFFDTHSTFDSYELQFIKKTNAIFDDFMNINFELSYFDYDENDPSIIYAYESHDDDNELTKLKFKYENDKLTFIEIMNGNDK